MSVMLILSEEYDVSTTNVMRWMFYLKPGIKIFRLHPIDVLNGKINSCTLNDPIKIQLENKLLNTNDIKAVWIRKCHFEIPTIDIIDSKLKKMLPHFRQNLIDEFTTFYNYFIFILEQNNSIYWLNKFHSSTPNKLIQLKIAQKSGFANP